MQKDPTLFLLPYTPLIRWSEPLKRNLCLALAFKLRCPCKALADFVAITSLAGD